MPHSLKATTCAWGQALVPREATGRPKARSLAGVSGTFHLVPSNASSRHFPKKAPGVAGRSGVSGVANGWHTALNSATNGRAPMRARAWHSAPVLTCQAVGCGHSHRRPLTTWAKTWPRHVLA